MSGNEQPLIGPGSTLDETGIVSEGAFMNDFNSQAKTAVDTPVVDTPPADDSAGDFKLPPPENAEPIFKDEQPGQQGPPPPLKPKQAAVKVELFLTVRNALQARLLALVAKSNTPEKYKLDDDELDMLAEVYAPYAEEYGGHIPAWVMLIAVEALTTGSKIIEAFSERRTNIKNERLRKNPAVAAAVSQAPADTAKERTRFDIDKDGYYAYDRHGNYVYKDDGREKASLDDIERLIEKNGRQKVMKIFGLSDDDLKQRGITE